MCNARVMVLAQTKVPVIIQLDPVFVIPDSKEICVKVNPFCKVCFKKTVTHLLLYTVADV